MYAGDGNSVRDLHDRACTYLNYVTDKPLASRLKTIADNEGWAYHRKSVRVTGNERGNGQFPGDMPRTVTVIELVERYVHLWHNNADERPYFLAWLKIPEIEGLPLQTTIVHSVAELTVIVDLNGDALTALGFEQWGENENGNTVLAMAGHSLAHIAQANGYSVATICELFGGTEASLTFNDQVFECAGCNTLQEDSDGYEYCYREVNGDLYGIACGCANDAIIEHYESYVNESSSALTLTAAEELVKSGKIVHVARYIGGCVDSEWGGVYDGECVDSGQPAEVLEQRLNAEPEAKFVMSMDDGGQFHTYWSLYRVV